VCWKDGPSRFSLVVVEESTRGLGKKDRRGEDATFEVRSFLVEDEIVADREVLLDSRTGL
jgi:hypothetical protein